jgi:hypothetical protein
MPRKSDQAIKFLTLELGKKKRDQDRKHPIVMSREVVVKLQQLHDIQTVTSTTATKQLSAYINIDGFQGSNYPAHLSSRGLEAYRQWAGNTNPTQQ